MTLTHPSPNRSALKSQRFREAREGDWTRLDRLLQRVDREGPAALDNQQLLAIPVLYRSALSALSVARATSLDHDLIDYLESLCARAYFFVYGARAHPLERLRRFFVIDWPATAQALWRETLAAVFLIALGTAVSYALVWRDPDWFYAFLPEGMAAGRDPTATTAFLRSTLYGGQHNPLSLFATFLFTHNAQIALFSFALGFVFCAPSGFLMIYNGCSLGALLALFVSRGLGFQLGGWLFIHGATELFAVALAGASGFRMGWALAFPGERSRIDAARIAGRQGATLMFGVVIMLFVAGLLEGLGRQLIELDLARYAIAVSTLAGWCAYLYWPRRTIRAAR
jgi:uncharacterized membrane protein SpoIIM required for sporulation